MAASELFSCGACQRAHKLTPVICRTYTSMETLVQDYASGALHPGGVLLLLTWALAVK